MIPFYAVLQEEGTEAMGAAGLSPGAGAMAAPEITIAAGVRAAVMGTGAQAGRTETATTVTVSPVPGAPCFHGLWWELSPWHPL